MDHTESMVLALQLYNVYRESILGFSSKKRWQVNALQLCPQLSCQRDFVLPGFAPAGEALLFWQKDPKPLTPHLALF